MNAISKLKNGLKKREIAIISIIVITLVLSIVKVSYADEQKEEFSRKEMQSMAVSTALSYLYNQQYSDYSLQNMDTGSSKVLSDAGKTSTDGAFRYRNLIEYPESTNRANQYYMACSGFPTLVYLHTFGYDFREYRSLASQFHINKNFSVSDEGDSINDYLEGYFRHGQGTTSYYFAKIAHNFAESKNSSYTEYKNSNNREVVQYSFRNSNVTYGTKPSSTSAKQSSTVATRVVDDVLELLQPGDVIAYTYYGIDGSKVDDHGGHVMMYVGDAVDPHKYKNDKYQNAIIHVTGYSDYVDGAAVRVASTEKIKALFDNDIVERFAVLRPINAFFKRVDSNDYAVFEINTNHCTIDDSTGKETVSTWSACKYGNSLRGNAKARVDLRRLRTEQYVTEEMNYSKYDGASTTEKSLNGTSVYYDATGEDDFDSSSALHEYNAFPSVNVGDTLKYNLSLENKSEFEYCADGAASVDATSGERYASYVNDTETDSGNLSGKYTSDTYPNSDKKIATGRYLTPKEQCEAATIKLYKSATSKADGEAPVTVYVTKDSSGRKWKTSELSDSEKISYTGSNSLTIENYVPAGTEYVEDSCVPKNKCSYSDGKVTWTGVEIGISSKVDISYKVKVVNDNGGHISNTGMRIMTQNNNKMKMNYMTTAVNPTLNGLNVNKFESILKKAEDKIDAGKLTYDGSSDNYKKDLTDDNLAISASGFGFPKLLYYNALGVDLSVFTKANILSLFKQKDSNDLDYMLQTSTSGLTSDQKKVKQMLVPGMYGGQHVRGNPDFKRVKFKRTDDLEYGDIIVYFYNQGGVSNYISTYIYLGDQNTEKKLIAENGKVHNEYADTGSRFIHFGSTDGGSIVYYDNSTSQNGRSFFESLYDKKIFAVFRPTRVYGTSVEYNYNNGEDGKTFVAYNTYKDLETPSKGNVELTYDFNYTGEVNETVSIHNEFGGWYSDQGANVISGSNLVSTAPHKLNAKWTSTNVLKTPSRAGYTFAGWYSDSNLTTKVGNGGEPYTPLDNQTLYAKWAVEDYTITYNLDGGVATNPTSYNMETKTFTLNNPTKAHSTFIGWTGSNGATPEKTVTIQKGTTGNLSYKANYEANGCTVSFNSNGGTPVGSQVVVCNNKAAKPTNPTRDHYDFDGWYTADSAVLYDFNTPVIEDIVLYAGWQPKTYTITFDTNGGSELSKLSVVYGDNTVAPNTPEKVGYTFVGWYSDSDLTKSYSFGSILDEDITLYAKWEKIKYPVMFNTNGGNLISNQEVEYGNKVVEPVTPVKEGYTFTGWYSDSDLSHEYDFDTSVTKALILYAGWQVKNYTITYNDNSANNPITYNIETPTFTLSNPTKEGYKFLGWTGSNGTTPEKVVTITKGTTGNLLYQANWEINKFVVEFDTNGGGFIANQTVEYKNKVAVPDTPSKMGYAFEGWYSDSSLDTAYDFNTEVTSNLRLYAKWIAGKRQITYILDGGIADNPTYYDENTETFTLNNPTKKGYKFLGWTGSNGNVPEKTVTIQKGTNEDLSYKANWEKETYTISFDIEGVDSIGVGYGDEIILPIPEKEGYSFVGWYKDSNYDEEFVETTMPAENIALYGKFVINSYAISFDSNGGSNISDIVLTYDQNIPSLPSSEKEGYSFVGWYSDESLTTEFDLSKMPARDVTLYAKWKKNTYEITFDTNGGSNINKAIVEYNERVSRPTDPSKVGYVFDNWYSDSALTKAYDFNTNIKENKTLYAKWNVKDYSIIFDLDGGVANNPVIYNIETESFILDIPTKEGCTFIGWTGSNGTVPEKIVTINKGTTGDLSYKANYDVNTYTISFDSNGGSAVNSITKKYNSVVEAPTNPTRENYKFAGWYSDSALTKLYSFSTMPAKNITLYAKWAKDEYVISYVLNGGINNLSNPTTYVNGDKISLKDPTKIGSTFKGWYKDADFNTKIEAITENMSGDIVLYALWEVNEYTISFDDPDVDSITAHYGEEISLPTLTKVGSTFKGWYTDSDLLIPFTEITMPARNVTLYAKWDINKYTISFDSNGGSKVSSISAEYGSFITEPTAPMKSGYKFAGWYSDKELTELYSFDTMPAKNITLYADWVKNDRNTIRYVLNGGKNNRNNPTSYITGEEKELFEPTKKNCEFDGWYLDSDFQTSIEKIDEDTAGDLVLYAKWIDGRVIEVPDTASSVSTVVIVAGIILLSTGAFVIFRRL